MNNLSNTELSHVVKKICLSNDKFIILVDTTEDVMIQKSLGMRNIFCVDANNQIIWQVYISETDKNNLKDTFIYVDLDNSGQLNADTFFGTEYHVNLKTGEAKKVGWHK